MNASAISAASSATGSSSNTNQIEARIQGLQLQIAQEKVNKTDDAQTKQQKIQALEAQIRQLEAQLNRANQSKSGAPTPAAANTDNPATPPRQTDSAVGLSLNAKA